MKSLKVFALVVLMLVVAVPMASAQITWNSSFTVVNLGTSDATVTVTFYCPSDNPGCMPGGADSLTPDPLVPGATPLPNPFTLAAGANTIVVMAYVNSTLPDGAFSVVISANQPIVAIANLAGDEAGVGYNGSYSGMEDAGQTEMYLPSVSKEYYDWNSHLSIQNLTNADMLITVDFFEGTTAAIHTASETVPAYAAWNLDVQADTPIHTFYNGSAVVSAAGPVAVVNNDYNQNVAVQGANQVYNGKAAGSQDLYCPGLYDLFIGTWISSLNVQNIGTTTATVDYTYSDGMTEQAQIGPNAALLLVYNTGAHAGTFSVHVHGTENLVAVANANSGAAAQTYECFTAGALEIQTPLTMKKFVGAFDTGVQIQNIGTTTATVTIDYQGTNPGEPYNVSVGPNATFIFATAFEPDTMLPPGYSGSASITSDQPVVGIVNQNYGLLPALAGDWALSFTMFPVTAP